MDDFYENTKGHIIKIGLCFIYRAAHFRNSDWSSQPSKLAMICNIHFKTMSE